MELNSLFELFLHDIRLTDGQRSELITGHQTLRRRLQETDEIAPLLVCNFLQGSYRRHTAVRPKNDRRADVDIVVVTKLDEADFATPREAMDVFVPFLEKNYAGKWRPQGRSFGIEMSNVDLDLVITSAPAESEVGILQSEAVTTDEDISTAVDWRLHRSWLALANRHRADATTRLKEANSQDEWKALPLRIPDREANKWGYTHPLEQIRWTRNKNRDTNGHFGNIVKTIKWWRLVKHEKPKHPKGFPLERIIGDCCPDGIESVAQGVVETLEAVVESYQIHAEAGTTPLLAE